MRKISDPWRKYLKVHVDEQRVKGMSSSISLALSDTTSNLRDINLGIVLIGAYFLLEFGSLQGLYPVVGILMIPYIVAVACSLYAVWIVSTNRIRFSSIISWPFVIFSLFTIAYSLISTIVPANRDANAKLFWSYLVNYVIVGYSIRKPSQLVLLIDIWLISVGYSSLHGFFQGGIVWGNQWISDENQYAVLMAMALPLNYFLFQSSPSRLRKIGYLSLGGLNVAGIVLSMSRTGIVTIVTIGLLILTLSKRKVRILLMGVLVIIFVIALAPQQFFDEADKLWSGERDRSVTSREFLWDAALKMFYSNPLMGVGPVNFPDYLILYDPEGLYGRLNWKGTANVAHSTPLTFLSETGIIGSLLILSVQFMLIRNWRKVRSKGGRIPGSSFSTSERMVFSAVSNAALIAQAGFWAGSLFISLTSWPFYYCLVSFSEAVKNVFAKNTGSDDEVSQ